MEITTEIVKQLRDKTGVSIMQCKKALEETHGDVDKAAPSSRSVGSATILFHKGSDAPGAKGPDCKLDRTVDTCCEQRYMRAAVS